jgi:hypothetical protein
MAVGGDPSDRPTAQLLFCVWHLPEEPYPELSSGPDYGYVAVVALQRNGHKVGNFDGGTGQSDHEDGIPGGDCAAGHISLISTQPFDRCHPGSSGVGDLFAAGKSGHSDAASFCISAGLVRCGNRLDCFEPAGLFAGYIPIADGSSDVLAMGDTDLYYGEQFSPQGAFFDRDQSLGLHRATVPGDANGVGPASLARYGDSGAILRWNFPAGRNVFPLYETRIRRRAIGSVRQTERAR